MESSNDEYRARQKPAQQPGAGLSVLVGKPSADFTVDDLVEVVRERRIALVALMHVGADARLKTLDFAPSDSSHLRDVLLGGERVDGSSLFGSLGIPTRASDITLRPRVETAFLDPFAPVPTLAVLCGHHARDGRPLDESPDTLVRRAAARCEQETGVALSALLEIEVFLGKPHAEGDVRSASDHGYHATSPLVFGEELRRRALVALAGMGVRVKYAHSENGHVEPDASDPHVWEQHEIELLLEPLPRAADAALLTTWVLGNLARREGWRCSFLPILRAGHVGSGMHVHLSPVVDGKHVESGVEGEMPQAAQALVLGLAEAGGALMAFGNRHSSSFVRLHQGIEAPSRVLWGRSDRKALIRLPIVARDPRGRPLTPPTVEFRLPDGSAHPHLLLAGIAQAFTHAFGERDLGPRVEALRSDGDDRAARAVPRGFAEIADELLARRALFEAGEVFPPRLVERLCDELRTRTGDDE
ncbi:MAG: hypothetical protein H6825_07925 [Planctomycetes bacterium]|nr:hypothetical protein [Planctomycetota bacterium]